MNLSRIRYWGRYVCLILFTLDLMFHRYAYMPGVQELVT